MNKYSLQVFWSEGDQSYVAICPTFPGLSGLAETQTEAIRELQIAIELAIEVYQEDGQPIPLPDTQPSENGRVLVRIPKQMHKRLNQLATIEGTSLNTLIVSMLAEGLGEAKSLIRSEDKLTKLVKLFYTDIRKLLNNNTAVSGSESAIQRSSLSTHETSAEYTVVSAETDRDLA